MNKFKQPSAIDLAHAWASHLAWRGLAGLTTSLFDTSGPGGTDTEHDCNLLGFHAAVVRRQHTISEVL